MPQLFSLNDEGSLFMTILDKNSGQQTKVQLGPVSAYGLAVQQGYKGSLTEWLTSLTEHPPGGEAGQFLVKSDKDGEVYAWKTVPNASETESGFMSAQDKKDLEAVKSLRLTDMITGKILCMTDDIPEDKLQAAIDKLDNGQPIPE